LYSASFFRVARHRLVKRSPVIALGQRLAQHVQYGSDFRPVFELAVPDEMAVEISHENPPFGRDKKFPAGGFLSAGSVQNFLAGITAPAQRPGVHHAPGHYCFGGL
jgi:hypothetical protein